METLVVTAIIALLVAIMSASLANVRAAGKSFVCKNQLRRIHFDFSQFASDYSPPWRGDSQQYGKSGFYIQDFHEWQYGVSEFWKGAAPQSDQGVAYEAAGQPMICPAGPRDLKKRPVRLDDEYAVGPKTSVSIGINMRLAYASIQDAPGVFHLKKNRLSNRITDQTTVPLAFDVDAAAPPVRDLGALPYYSAPPVSPADGFVGCWFPSLRHGQVNAIFIGGHLLSSAIPERASSWNWKYQPPVK